ncbi:GNP1, partial [Candida margitis]|uniref:GNP1 n=1 Tax=Candida margitis TaxID=1775924 RepID=UPI002227EE8D
MPKMSFSKPHVVQLEDFDKADDTYSSASGTISPQHNHTQGFKGHWDSFIDGFQRAPPTANQGDDRKKAISKNELRLMSLSTGLGTGLLVAAGDKLRMAGPAGVLIAYAITGLVMLVPTISSVSELSIAYPGLPGGFQSYYSKFIDDSLGFSLGWGYAFQWCCVISLELVTAAMTIKFWTLSVNPD